MGSSSCANVAEEELGALPRAITAISQLMQQSAQADAQAATQCVRLTSRAILSRSAEWFKSKACVRYSLLCSFVEIHNEELHDLLCRNATASSLVHDHLQSQTDKLVCQSLAPSTPHARMHVHKHAHTTVSTGTTVDCQCWR